MKDATGSTYWMFPTSIVTYAVISLDAVLNVQGYYDLTGQLSTQMPGLKPFKTTKNGYVYYNNTKG